MPGLLLPADYYTTDGVKEGYAVFQGEVRYITYNRINGLNFYESGQNTSKASADPIPTDGTKIRGDLANGQLDYFGFSTSASCEARVRFTCATGIYATASLIDTAGVVLRTISSNSTVDCVIINPAQYYFKFGGYPDADYEISILAPY